jgi:hypothetical protein
MIKDLESVKQLCCTGFELRYPRNCFKDSIAGRLTTCSGSLILNIGGVWKEEVLQLE